MQISRTVDYGAVGPVCRLWLLATLWISVSLAGCGRNLQVSLREDRSVVVPERIVDRPVLRGGESLFVYTIENKEIDSKSTDGSWTSSKAVLRSVSADGMIPDVEMLGQNYGNIFHVEVYASDKMPANPNSGGSDRLVPYYGDVDTSRVVINKYQVRKPISTNNVKYGVAYIPSFDSVVQTALYSIHPAVGADVGEGMAAILDSFSVSMGMGLGGTGGRVDDRWKSSMFVLGFGLDYIDANLTFGINGGVISGIDRDTDDIEYRGYVGITLNIGQVIGNLTGGGL